jgi:hypothetical protein
MAINRISYPSSTPTAVSDYQQQNVLIQAALNEGESVIPWSGASMTIGFRFSVGGVLYQVDTATSISGSPSRFVKITPAGATASASFVASLTGVSWNTTYNGLYDGSGNLYLIKNGTEKNLGNYTDTGAAIGNNSKSSNGGFAGGDTNDCVSGSASGTNCSVTGGGASAGSGCSTQSGASIGSGSTSTDGSATGSSAQTTDGSASGRLAVSTTGGSAGLSATTTTGGSVGASSSSTTGGAVGSSSTTTTGGSIGNATTSTNGFSGGDGAASGDNQANLFNHVKYAYFPAATTQNVVYDFLSPLLITTGRVVSAIGIFGSSTVQSAQRSGASAIQVTAGGAPTTFTDGSATTIGSDLSILLVKGT